MNAMNMRKIKHYGYIALLSVGTFLTTGCSENTEGEVSPPSGNGQISLLLTVQNDLQARVALESSKHEQKVKSVELYIFDGESPDSECKSSQTIDWEGMPTGELRASKSLTITDLPCQKCLLMAVGMDEEAKTAYGLPAAIPIGTTLSEAKAQLATGQNYTAIAQAPIFSGTVVVTSETKTAEIILERRVAGILCYLDHIPASLPTEDGTYVRVDKIQLVLNQKQNTAVSLKKQEANDYGSNPSTDENSRIVASFGTSEALPSIQGNYYKFPAEISGGVQLWTTQVFQGAFIFPIQEVTGGEATLSLQAVDEFGSILQPTWQLTNGASLTYPLEANTLYRIGNNMENIPLDLEEDEIILLPDYEMIHNGKSKD